MSYILEALKKAQAERQLGNAPTIHAPQPAQASAAAGDGLAGSRKPLLFGIGAGVIVALAGAALLWHRTPALQVAQAPQAAAAGSSSTSSSAPAPTSAPPAPMPVPAAPAGGASATLAVRAPESLPPPMPAAARAADTHPAVPAAPAPPLTRTAPGADARSVTPMAAAPAPVAAQALAAPAAPEDSLPSLQQLPESIRAQIPRVSFGGYMYSANPADRLVLVDKGLRHEGEEVGPGLVLEKLLPHAAVMNFRGVRYRVAY